MEVLLYMQLPWIHFQVVKSSGIILQIHAPLEGSAAVSFNNKYLLAVGDTAVDDAMCVLLRKKLSPQKLS